MLYMSELLTATYLSDYLDPGSIKAEGTREGASAKFHDENLYDVDENGAGEFYDLTTGEPYDNSTFTDATYWRTTEAGFELSPMDLGEDQDHEDVLGGIRDPGFENDPAAQWLAEHERALLDQSSDA